MAFGVVDWRGEFLKLHVVSAAERALGTASEFGHIYWDAVVPISSDPRTSGDLRRSWDSVVDVSTGYLLLTISANTRYAIYWELGTSKMGPRGGLRATGGEIAAILPFHIAEELSR